MWLKFKGIFHKIYLKSGKKIVSLQRLFLSGHSKANVNLMKGNQQGETSMTQNRPVSRTLSTRKSFIIYFILSRTNHKIQKSI